MDGFHYDAHPMGMLIGTVGALSTFYPDAKQIFDEDSRRKQTYRLIAKVATIAAFAYRRRMGLPYAYPDNDLSFTGNFLKRRCCSIPSRRSRGHVRFIWAMISVTMC